MNQPLVGTPIVVTEFDLQGPDGVQEQEVLLVGEAPNYPQSGYGFTFMLHSLRGLETIDVRVRVQSLETEMAPWVQWVRLGLSGNPGSQRCHVPLKGYFFALGAYRADLALEAHLHCDPIEFVVAPRTDLAEHECVHNQVEEVHAGG